MDCDRGWANPPGERISHRSWYLIILEEEALWTPLAPSMLEGSADLYFTVYLTMQHHKCERAAARSNTAMHSVSDIGNIEA